MAQRGSGPPVFQKAIGLCTKCGKSGPIFFFAQESHQLCHTCTVKLWVNSTSTGPEPSKEAAALKKLKLRDHPALNRFDLSTWPPVWVNSARRNQEFISERGAVTGVLYDAKTPERIFLQMDFEGERYTGCLMTRDSSFCRQLHGFLQDHIGKTAQEIGDLDVSFML
jgi:hypothetical protein